MNPQIGTEQQVQDPIHYNRVNIACSELELVHRVVHEENVDGYNNQAEKYGHYLCYSEKGNSKLSHSKRKRQPFL